MPEIRLSSIWIVVAITTVIAAQSPSPSPVPSGTPTTKAELKQSLERFKSEAKETKQEAANALEESKVEPPSPMAPSVVMKKPKRKKIVKTRRLIRSPQEIVKAPIVIITTTVGETESQIIIRVLTPVPAPEEVQPDREQEREAEQKKSFLQRLWHVLPFRFFGEH